MGCIDQFNLTGKQVKNIKFKLIERLKSKKKLCFRKRIDKNLYTMGLKACLLFLFLWKNLYYSDWKYIKSNSNCVNFLGKKKKLY